MWLIETSESIDWLTCNSYIKDLLLLCSCVCLCVLLWVRDIFLRTTNCNGMTRLIHEYNCKRHCIVIKIYYLLDKLVKKC